MKEPDVDKELRNIMYRMIFWRTFLIFNRSATGIMYPLEDRTRAFAFLYSYDRKAGTARIDGFPRWGNTYNSEQDIC